MYKRFLTHAWVKVSHGVGSTAPELLPLTNLLQGLGGLSLCLDEIEAKIIAEIAAKHELEASFLMDEAFLNSHMWVLSSYEVVRTLAEFYNPRKNKRAPVAPIELRNELESAKNQFAEIRMPLAKLQPKGPSNTYIVPWPILVQDTGAIGWQITEGNYILRRNLAEVFFNALDAVQRLHPRGVPKTSNFDG